MSALVPIQSLDETPRSRYLKDLSRDDFRHDDAQDRVIVELDRLHRELVDTHPRPRRISRYLRTWRRPRWHRVTGLYLWGGVGRGKTYLMDCFHETLPFPDTIRAHFHPFMAQLHADLSQRTGEKDPLRTIADRLAQQARVVCFDEFFVSDITDAMLLGTLFRYLFSQGVTLVATSNVPPCDLYRNGLQRDRFLPAIATLERYTTVMEIGAGEDFRLRALTAAETYHTPLDAAGEVVLAHHFHRLCPHPDAGRGDVTILGRSIPVRKVGKNVAWFDFSVLCGERRSQQDYMELAAQFETLLVSRIPVLDALHDDAARRLIHLVDVAYDHRIKLIITAEGEPETLYRGQRLAFEFVRTASRLREMGSMEYLALAHRH